MRASSVVLLLFLLGACAEVAPGHTHQNAIHVDEIAMAPESVPPPLDRNASTVDVFLRATEVEAKLSENQTFHYWTFNNTLPGPMLRVKEGDTVKITLENDNTSQIYHSIDLHAVTGPGGGATVTQVAPGQQKSFTFKALNPGLYVYHCATPMVAEHMANGMYGMILVEPKEGLSEVDREFYVMQGEIYLERKSIVKEQPDFVVFNGRLNALLDYPLKAEVNETVRIFVGNGGVSKISSFHVIGEIFDTVYHEAGTLANHNVQTTLVPAGGASIVEFKTNVPGKFVLVDHALARLEKGAMGMLEVKGAEQERIFNAT